MTGEKDAYLIEMGRRIKELLRPYKSFREASAALGIPEATLARLARGAHDPSTETLLKLSQKLNVSMSYLVGTLDDPTPPEMSAKGRLEFERVPSLDARVAAGHGAVNGHVSVESRLAFPLWMLQKLAPPGAKLSFMRAHGDSMEPLFGDGALLLVNESATTIPETRPKNGGASDLFVFLDDDALRVKRLRKLAPSELLVMSENRAYDVEVLRGPRLKRLKVIGRVVWWDDRL